MTNENLLNARNAYRIKKGFLTSYEIVEIRESYGLSQVDLAKLMGWGEATISRYESKAIQDEAYDTIQRAIRGKGGKYVDGWKDIQQNTSEALVEKLFRKMLPDYNSYIGNYYQKDYENDLLLMQKN